MDDKTFMNILLTDYKTRNGWRMEKFSNNEGAANSSVQHTYNGKVFVACGRRVVISPHSVSRREKLSNLTDVGAK